MPKVSMECLLDYDERFPKVQSVQLSSTADKRDSVPSKSHSSPAVVASDLVDRGTEERRECTRSQAHFGHEELRVSMADAA